MSGERLLYVVNIPRFFLSHRLPLALAAQRAGYDVHVATAQDDDAGLAAIRRHGFTVHAIPLEQHGTSAHREILTVLALIGLMRRLRPDLVHLITIKPVLYGGIAARITRRRAVIAAMSGLGRVFRDESGQPRDPGPLVARGLRFALPSRTSHVLTQNEEDRDLLLSLGVADPDASSVIPGSGVDLAEFHPQPRDGDPESPVTFLYAGRLMEQKGLVSFVEAARRLSGDARFLVAGYAEEHSPGAVPVRTVEQWAAEGTIEWLGARDDMPQVIANSDVVVLPSVYGEGVPRTLIEAAASGRAIVTTDTPGCRDICRDGVNGLLVAPGDDDALVDAMRRLVADPSESRRLSAAGREIAESRFGLSIILERTLALYASVAAAAR
jgi:glycosyltransferase involved in cell wall biosynthesis